MRLVLILIALCFSLFAQAQITFLSTDIPVPADTLPNAVDTLPSGVSPGAAGANQTWVITNVVTRINETPIHKTAAQSGYGGSFPTATNAITPDGVNYGFFRNTGTAYVGQGLVIDLLGNGNFFTINFSPTFETYQFPTQYGGSFNGNYGFVQTASGASVGQPGVNQVRVTFTSTYTDVIDGWGTVTTPTGTYNCLRQKRTEVTRTVVDFKLFSISPWANLSDDQATTITYYYLAKETRGPAAVVATDNAGTVTRVTWSLIAPPPPPPVANFTYTNPYGGFGQFTNTSTGNPTSYSWDFGDGTSSTQTSPNHTYAANGTYTVCLIATNAGGSDTTCKSVTIGGIFTANITGPGSKCANQLTGLTFSTPLMAGHTYVWTATNGSVTTGAGTNSITASFTGTPASVTVNECDATGNYCDSDTYTVTVLPTATSTVTKTICAGTSFEGYSATGNYTNTFTAANGCDSVRTLNLTVRAANTTTVTKTICAGDNYQGYTTSNTYVDTYTDRFGCDSVRTLNLTVRAVNATTVNATICPGASYQSYTTAGTFIDTYTNRFGCDSTRTLNLAVQVFIVDTLSLGICYNTTYQGYGSTGTYSDTFLTSNCDSIRVLLLTVRPENRTNVSAIICAGDTLDGYTTAGIYTNTFTDQFGCDSTRRLDLTVLIGASSIIDSTICFGQSVFGYMATGTYFDTLTASNGCDSIRQLNLVVLTPSGSTFTKTICFGESFEGYTASGSYVDQFTAANGCDSIRTLNLTVRLVNATTVNKTVCFGVTYAGHSATGTYTDVLTDANNCDSTRTLNLTVLPQLVTTIVRSICNGDSVEGYFATGIYRDTFATSGCDSIRILNLQVGQYVMVTFDTAVCAGDSVLAGGMLQTATGTYYDTIVRVGSCDEILVTNLMVNAAPADPNISQNADTLSVPDDNVTYVWYLNGDKLDSTSGNILLIDSIGTYIVEVTDTNGCTAFSKLKNVTSVGIFNAATFTDLVVYPNPTNGLLYVSFTSADAVNIELLNAMGQSLVSKQAVASGKLSFNLNGFAQGVYFVKISSQESVVYKRVIFTP